MRGGLLRRWRRRQVDVKRGRLSSSLSQVPRTCRFSVVVGGYDVISACVVISVVISH